jgi:hypothetical protein
MVKKFILIGAIGILAASLGFAQRGGRGGGGGGGDMGGGMPMAAAPSKLDNISNALNLSKDQKKAVKTMLDDGAKEALPLRDQLSKTRLAVAEAIQNKKSDDDLKQAETATAAVAAQISHLEMKTFAKIYSSLDDNQKGNRQGIAMVFGMMNGIFRNKNWNED